jgi:hypothetical protein
MDIPKITIVGTPDLPQGIREMFGDALGKAHDRVEIGSDLIGYRVVHRQDGVVYLSNVIFDDAGDEWFEDDRDEAVLPISELVPCRLDYHVCPECLRTIRAHAHVIEDESEEDRPHPAIDDAWDQVEGSGLLCGGDHCDDPPQEITWNTPDGSVKTRLFPSTSMASFFISGIVQLDPALSENLYISRNEIIELYEALEVKSCGTFVRRDLDSHTGSPKEQTS